ncbi:hypothetical protein [Streptomyces sp. SP17KL33]|uniref:hypothetical protein n=1 Tax=Streptomyces sp. SP17KL33 TaxID=3002534 RepID=UPI002E797C18|nr:hypothetical protein [Streptomyces sp. SP17KL33]MEE1831738.1 hypothetical protein [Streptomyces sp. SP17KL33]
MRQVYIRLPDGRLHEIPWIHRDHVHAPMSETAWRHIRAALGRRTDRERHEADLAEAADQVLRRARPLPGTGTPSAAAAGRAAATSTAGPQTADAGMQAEDGLDVLEARFSDADGRRDGGEELSAPAGRYALYDAFEEAEHW